MVIIKKNGSEYRIPNEDFVASQDVTEGLYLKLKDGSEIRLLCDDPNLRGQLLTAAKILERGAKGDVTINFDTPRRFISVTTVA